MDLVKSCKTCNVEGNLRIEQRGSHIALVCGVCGSWIKWIGKKELPMYEKFILSAKSGISPRDKLKNNLKKAIISTGIDKEELLTIIEEIYS